MVSSPNFKYAIVLNIIINILSSSWSMIMSFLLNLSLLLLDISLSLEGLRLIERKKFVLINKLCLDFEFLDASLTQWFGSKFCLSSQIQNHKAIKQITTRQGFKKQYLTTKSRFIGCKLNKCDHICSQ